MALDAILLLGANASRAPFRNVAIEALRIILGAIE